jgi:cold shock protein
MSPRECVIFLRRTEKLEPPARPARPLGEERRMPQTGTVKFFNMNKGFGFITPDNGGPDIFLHVTAVERAGLASLNEGQRVSFETEPDKKGKGPKAVNLQLI